MNPTPIIRVILWIRRTIVRVRKLNGHSPSQDGCHIRETLVKLYSVKDHRTYCYFMYYSRNISTILNNLSITCPCLFSWASFASVFFKAIPSLGKVQWGQDLKSKKRNLMAFSKSLRTSSSGFRTLGAGFFSCEWLKWGRGTDRNWVDANFNLKRNIKCEPVVAK